MFSNLYKGDNRAFPQFTYGLIFITLVSTILNYKNQSFLTDLKIHKWIGSISHY